MSLIEMSEGHKPWHPYDHAGVIRDYENSPLDPYGEIPTEAKKSILSIAEVIGPAERRILSSGSNRGAQEDAEFDGVGVSFNVPDFEGRLGTIRVHVDFLMQQTDEQESAKARDVYFIYPNGVGILNKTIFNFGGEIPLYRITDQRFVTRGEIPVLGIALSVLS